MKAFGYFILSLIFIWAQIGHSDSVLAQKKASNSDSLSFIRTNVSYTADFLRNQKGGLTTGNAFLGKFDFGLSISTEYMGLWKGGQVNLLASAIHGDTPSQSIIGDYQVASNIEAGNKQNIQELYYQHHWKNWQIKAGIQDMNCDFALSETAGNFINSSFGIHPTITGNVPSSVYPLTALGVNISYSPFDALDLKAGFYDGEPGDSGNQPFHMNWSWRNDDGVFGISEIQWKIEKFTRIKIGTYYHTHCLETAKRQEDKTKLADNYGAYLVAEENLIRSGQRKILDLFLQAGIAPESKNINPLYLGGGLVTYLPGTINYLENIGLAFAHAHFNQKIQTGDRNCESTIETNCTLSLNTIMNIQPCFQYIINPGFQKNLPDAFLALLRVNMHFN